MYRVSPRKKTPHIYKTVYLPEALADKIEEVSIKNDTSFNFALVSILEKTLFPEQPEIRCVK